MSRATDVPVRNLMTSDLVTLHKSQSLDLAAELMRLDQVRHLPVIDDKGHLVGLVTHRDLLRAQAGLLSGGNAGFLIPVAQIMRTQVWTVDVESSALEAARIKRDHRFGCLPVIQAGRLVGIVTEADFLDLVIAAWSEPSPPEPRARSHLFRANPPRAKSFRAARRRPRLPELRVAGYCRTIAMRMRSSGETN